jgi:hypothetical protein
MILVVMIGMTIAFSYVVFYSNNYKAGAGSSVLESLTIEDVWNQNNIVHVTVYNSATKENLGYDVNVQVTSIYIDGKALVTDQNNPGSYVSGPVNAGEHLTFTGLSTEALSGSHQLSVATSRGSNFKTTINLGGN